jgi:polyhydroxyalkanoate synthesis regulator phasin
MRTKITERDITRIVKNLLNEGTPSLEGVKDELRHVSQKLIRSMDEYGTLQRKGEYKRMGDEIDNIRRLVRKLKDLTQQIESKI